MAASRCNPQDRHAQPCLSFPTPHLASGASCVRAMSSGHGSLPRQLRNKPFPPRTGFAEPAATAGRAQTRRPARRATWQPTKDSKGDRSAAKLVEPIAAPNCLAVSRQAPCLNECLAFKSRNLYRVVQTRKYALLGKFLLVSVAPAAAAKQNIEAVYVDNWGWIS